MREEMLLKKLKEGDESVLDQLVTIRIFSGIVSGMRRIDI